MANYDVESHKQTSLVQNNVWFFILAPYARTTRYEEAFLPKVKIRPHYLVIDSVFLETGTF